MVNGNLLTDNFIEALNIKFPVVNSWDDAFDVQHGRKFNKIVRSHNGQSKSVFAFVEIATGKLIKAATWSAPAKRVDGTLQSKWNLDTEFNEAIDASDKYGGFLYSAQAK